MKKKKLDLKELELQLPAIDSNETKIILGGNNYGDGSNTIEIDFITDDFIFTAVFRDNVGGDGDGNLQDQGDFDHYYDNDGDDNDGADYDVDGPGNNPGTDPNIFDGLDVSEYDNLVIETGNPVFDQAIEQLLESNSELGDLLKELLSDGTNEIKFSIGDLGNDPTQPYKMAQTTQPDPNRPYSYYEITFNSHSFDQNGNYIFDGQSASSDGTNLADLTPDEELAVNVAHELLHIQYDEQVREAYDQMVANQEYLSDLAEDLATKYGDDFRDAHLYFDGSEWQWRDLSDPAQQAIYSQYIHEYMQEHGQDFIQQVLDEYRQDFP